MLTNNIINQAKQDVDNELIKLSAEVSVINSDIHKVKSCYEKIKKIFFELEVFSDDRLDAETVEEINISLQTKLNTKDASDRTLLHLACLNPQPNCEIVSFLIKCGVEINAKDLCASTALHYACQAKSSTAPLIKLLIENGASKFAKDTTHCSPIHYLCANSNITKELLELVGDKKNIYSKTTMGKLPLHIYCKKQHQLNLEIIKILANNDSASILYNNKNDLFSQIDTSQATALFYLLENEGLTREIFNHVFHYTTIKHSIVSGTTYLHVACKNIKINKKILDDLYERFKNIQNNLINFDLEDKEQWLPINLACLFQENLEIIHYLAKQNPANITHKSFSALCYNSHINKILFEEFARYDKNGILKNPNLLLLHTACANANPSIEFIGYINSLGFDWNQENANGELPLHKACSNPNMTAEILQYIIAKTKASCRIDNLNELIDSDGGNLLHYVCHAKEPNLIVIKILIASGVDLLKNSRHNQTPICFFLHTHANQEILALLFNYIENPFQYIPDQSITYIEFACQNNFLDIIKLLMKKLSKENMNQKLPILNGHTLLQQICIKINMNAELYQLFLESFSDVTIENSQQQNLLHLLCQKKTPCLMIVKDLVNKLPISSQDVAGNTALHYALKNEIYLPLVKILVENGADLHIANQDKITPWQLLCESIDENSYKLLSKIIRKEACVQFQEFSPLPVFIQNIKQINQLAASSQLSAKPKQIEQDNDLKIMDDKALLLLLLSCPNDTEIPVILPKSACIQQLLSSEFKIEDLIKHYYQDYFKKQMMEFDKKNHSTFKLSFTYFFRTDHIYVFHQYLTALPVSEFNDFIHTFKEQKGFQRNLSITDKNLKENK